ncbi:MAG: tetratricopeptide repeat protein [Burkholderiales bacterium]|nr:tetratricopeptide repeat protein [Burkholderiales bacterium]
MKKVWVGKIGKWQRGAILCAALCGLWASQAVALTAQDIFRQASYRIWVLETLDAKDRLISSAGAVMIDAGKAIVQCDGLQGAATIRLVRGEKIIRAEQTGGADREGLCLLALSDPVVAAPVEFLQKNPEVGVRVFAVSNALQLGLSISEGVVSGIRDFGGDTYIQFTAAIAPGSEGGGLFDAEGRLLGFITYRARDGQNVNFAIPIRRLAELEKRLGAASAADGLSATANGLMQQAKWTDLAQHAKTWLAADANSGAAWAWLGIAAQQMGDWPEAERAYREVLKRDPNAILFGVGLSNALRYQKKTQEAADVARSLLAIRQEDASIWVALGQAELGLDHGVEAKQAFARALQVDSFNYEAHLGLSRIARANRDWRTAAAAHRAMARMTPNDVNAWLLLTEVYLFDQRPKRALASAEQAIAIAPDNSDAKLFKGAALVMDRRYREGIKVLQYATDGPTQRPGWAWGNLGSAYYALKMYPEAIGAYTEAVKLQPAAISPKQSLGLALKDGLRFTEALALFEELKAANPDDPFPWRQIGYVHSYRANPEQAIPAYKQSLQLDSKQSRVWQALIEAYHVAGRKEEMKRAYEQLRTIDAQTAETVYKRMIFPYEGSAL